MQRSRRRRLALLLGIGVEGGVALLALALGWLFALDPLDQIRWNFDAWTVGTASTLPLLIVFTPLLRWPVGPMARIERFMNEFFRPLFSSCTLIDLALISALAGFGEELLFRGVLQTWLGDYLAPWTNLLVTNLLFGLMHPITLTYIFLAGGMGAYLGWLYLVTHNLLVPMVAHGLYDFIVLVLILRFRRTQSNGPPA